MDLDDILNSALDEVELGEEEEDSTPEITTALSEAAASNAKSQTESALKAAETASAAAAGEPDIASLMKMFSGEGGEADFEKMLADMFKDLNVDDLISKLGEGGGGAGGPGGEPDMAELLKLLGGAGGGGGPGADDLAKLFSGGAGGAQSEEEMTKLLDQMMKSVMTKDLMYGPVKQICDEFPAHLAKTDIPPTDRKRFEQQQAAYQALLKEFEVEGETNSDRIAQIMRDLESYGQPPPEVMKLVGGPGGMPGLGAAANNENPCPTQ
ncbi:hypothetical protein BASA81_000392 [Batrachochytrium salamandrivorans]|nr:hypothetical protein BASA81_000392 [Batrachochytrium salamandrivorans]